VSNPKVLGGRGRVAPGAKSARPIFARPRAHHRPRAHAWLDCLEPRTLFAATAPTVIDLMVVYDADAKAQLKVDDAGMQKLIQQSVAAANQVHYNTQDNVVLRLVHTEQVDYSNNGGSISTDLSRLSTPGDGYLDSVQALRDTYGADLVSLVSTPGGTTAGLANLLDDINRPDRADLAYSVLQATAMGPDSFVLTHETGHNLGAGHERDNTTDPTPNPVFPYAFGYHFVGNNGVTYGDVMSYQGMELPYFSNPNLTYQGQPLGRPAGDPNAADLYSTFLQTAPVVANYRPSVTTDTTAPTASVYQADLTGNQLTFTVRYADDVAVSTASIGDGDVYVRTPEGFNLAATLVSVDRPADDGYAKLATYRVTLPASNPPMASLGFFLNANQVQDESGNTAPAAAVPYNVDFDVERWQYQLARDTGTLTGPATRGITGGLSVDDIQDYYKFTLTQTTPVSVRLGGLTAPAEIFLMQDVDGNGLFGGGNEQLAGTPNSPDLGERSFSRVLPAGTYYVLVQLDDPGAGAPQPATPYTLTVRALADTVAPTATLDAVDATASTTTLNFSVIYVDDQELDATSVAFNAIVRFQAQLVTGTTYAGHTGAPNAVTPLADGRLVASYSVNLGIGAIPNALVTLSVDPLSAVKDAAGNPLPTGTTLGQYRIVTNPVTNDTIVPTATLRSSPAVLVPGGTTYDFVIAYKDNRGINSGSLDDADVVVSGPGNFTQSASFVGSTVSPGGAFRYATYRLTAPGGSWDSLDNGTYTLTLQPSQVADLTGNVVAAGAVGTFTVHAPFPGDAGGDDVTNFSDLLVLAKNYNMSGAGYAAGDFNFDGEVNFADLLILAKYYGKSASSSPVPVPEVPPVPAPLPLPDPSDPEDLLTDVATSPSQTKAASVFSSKSWRGWEKGARKAPGQRGR
jgi:hypothetical protein